MDIKDYTLLLQAIDNAARLGSLIPLVWAGPALCVSSKASSTLHPQLVHSLQLLADEGSLANAQEAQTVLLEDMAPQDSFTSASEFYSPGSQMASRRQSTTSSEAWFDAHSQMTSRASSVTTPGTSDALPAAPSGAKFGLAVACTHAENVCREILITTM